MKKVFRNIMFLSLLALLFLVGPITSVKAEPISPIFRVYYTHYQSFSQTRINSPIGAGFPSFEADLAQVELALEKSNSRLYHNLSLTLGLPTKVTSDNGLGENLLLQRENSDYSTATIDYHFLLPLFTWKDLSFSQGLDTSLLYENRRLTYRSGETEAKWDINTGFGPITQIHWDINPDFYLVGQFQDIFYLPYLSYGHFMSTNQSGDSYETVYRPFTYAAAFEIKGHYRLDSETAIMAGYRHKDLVGFGGREPDFAINDIISYRLDRTDEFFLEYVINF